MKEACCQSGDRQASGVKIFSGEPSLASPITTPASQPIGKTASFRNPSTLVQVCQNLQEENLVYRAGSYRFLLPPSAKKLADATALDRRKIKALMSDKKFSTSIEFTQILTMPDSVLLPADRHDKSRSKMELRTGAFSAELMEGKNKAQVSQEKLQDPAQPREKKKKTLERFVKEIEDPAELQNRIDGLKAKNWDAADVAEFICFSTRDKLLSAAFQVCLQDLDQVPKSIEVLACNTKEILMNDKYGCHVIRVLVKKLPSLLVGVSELALTDFRRFSCNENSTKVLQAVATLDSHYRTKFMQRFSQEWDNVVGWIWSNHLISMCLRYTHNSSPSFRAIGKILLSRSRTLIEDKYDKRVLASYMEYCDENEMDLFFSILRFKNELPERCQDKYMVYIFRLLLRRGHKKSEKVIIDYIQYDELLSRLLWAKFFRLLLHEIFVDKKEALVELQNQLMEIFDDKMSSPNEDFHLRSTTLSEKDLVRLRAFYAEVKKMRENQRAKAAPTEGELEDL
jgi:hypothetical protein